MKIPIVLTIAGSDSGAGAGIQADLKTFAALGVYGVSVITALTAQNTRGVQAVEAVSAGFVRQQMESILADFDLSAIKIGMLQDAGIVTAVAEMLQTCPEVPVVLDPVLVSSSGRPLLDPAAVVLLKKLLLPRVSLLTPNLPELATLLDIAEPTGVEEIYQHHDDLLALGAEQVLVKGGHGQGENLTDILFGHDEILELQAERQDVRNTHGTGCTLSAAIAAELAQGMPMETAVQRAHSFLQGALKGAAGWQLGSGHGPVDHFHAVRRQLSIRGTDV